MKKIIPFVLAVASMGVLAGCGGGNDADFQEVIDSTLVYAPSDVLPGLGGGNITDDNTPGSGNAVRVVRKLVLGENKTAEISWDFSESESMVYSVTPWDDYHDLVELNFPAEISYFNFKVKEIKIDGAKRKYADLNKLYASMYPGEDFTYQVVCNPAAYKYDTVSLDYFGKLNSAKDGYNVVDYSVTPAVIAGNQGQKKFDCITRGKIVYIAPDYDFGIIADGDAYMNVFMGSARTSAANDFHAFRVGKYVEIRGYLDQYKSTFQMTIINRIRELSAADAALIKEPTAPITIDENYIKTNFKISGDTKHNYVVEGLMSRMASATGTYVAGSLKTDKSVAATSITAGSRFTFDLQVGSEVLTVAFDYHTQIEAELNKVLAGGTYKLTGCMKYAGGGSVGEKKGEGAGVWNLVPLSASDVVAL